MLKELKISNFRVFDDEVTIRFRPITVLIGRNNSGKSSIIKFLLMLQQSLDFGSSQFLNPEGSRVQLGTFPDLKNSLTKKRNLTFQLTVGGDSSPSYNLSSYLINKKEDLLSLSYVIKATVAYSQKGQTGSTKMTLSSVENEKIIVQRRKISHDSLFLDFSNEQEMSIFDKLEEKRISLFLSEKECETILRYQINALYHLLPVREESRRVIIASPPPKGNVGQRGQYALPHLQQLMHGDAEGYKFIRSHIKSVAGISDIKFTKSFRGYIARCLGTNAQTSADVHISDFGFGVSQCIPIFVQGAIMPQNTSLMVEQPEAQLHPTAQLELGSFFANLWKKRKVGSVIETHSDNVLLRLRRLISKGKLASEDVSVEFFDFKNGKSIVKHLDIYEDGSMEEGLPMEFFGANIIEGLHMGAGK